MGDTQNVTHPGAMNNQWQTSNGNGLSTFMAYLQELKVQLCPPMPGYRELWLKQTILLNQVLPRHTTLLFLWDLAASEMVFVQNGSKSHSDHAFPALNEAAGFANFFSNIHPDCQPAALLFYRAMLDALFQESVRAKEQPVLSFNFLYKRETGGYLQLLQQIVVAERDEAGRPLLLLCPGCDITYLLKEHTANLIIATPQLFSMWCYNFSSQRLEMVHPLTAQETKVLQALSEGKDTRDIAAALYTSPHTIDTHRRNLLRKTGCVDTTALVTYLKMIGHIP